MKTETLADLPATAPQTPALPSQPLTFSGTAADAYRKLIAAEIATASSTPAYPR